MWALPKRQDVRAWIRAVEIQAKSRHGRPVSRGGTVYFGKNSRRWALKFYSKGDELERGGKGHTLPGSLPMCDMLMSHADNKLRGELTLRAMQLKKLGLARGSAWTAETPQQLLAEHIASLQMADQFTLSTEAIEGLPPRLLLVYEAWRNGKDMRQILPLRTFYRYRKELLKRGIDINVRQPAQPENVVPLVRVLQPQAIVQVPEWARGTPLYFEPRKKSK
jgi:II/X family phage/plasmid replication protein